MPNRRTRVALCRPALLRLLVPILTCAGPPPAAAREAGARLALERPAPDQPALERTALERLDQIAPAFSRCWAAPAGLRGLEAVEVTARFSLRRDGSLFGSPRVTFATADVALHARELLTRSAVEAIRACTPLRISPGLGEAVAGRPFAIRFIYKGPKGRGT